MSRVSPVASAAPAVASPNVPVSVGVVSLVIALSAIRPLMVPRLSVMLVIAN